METTTKKSLLYKSKVEYADFCINHVEGCAHGCRFPCYAMLMAKRFGRIRSYSDWIKPKLVRNALELLDEELPKYADKINFVHLCFTTDPFMYKYPEVGQLTLKIIQKLNDFGVRCTVLTKGVFPRALADVEKYGENNEYGITLVSLDEGFRKDFEPHTASYSSRIAALRKLCEAGLRTWISMEPYPTPNIVEQDLGKILDSVSFADRVIFGKLNYNAKSREFPNSGFFYEQCAGEVARFCKNNKLDYHIKFGTQASYNTRTQSLFRQRNEVKLVTANGKETQNLDREFCIYS